MLVSGGKKIIICHDASQKRCTGQCAVFAKDIKSLSLDYHESRYPLIFILRIVV